MNTKKIYFTEGSRDFAEGLTIGFYEVDENGNIVSGSDIGFMKTEISQKEYAELSKEIKSGRSPLGAALGLVNEKGQAALKLKFEELNDRQRFQVAGQAALGRTGSDDEYKEAIEERVSFLKKQAKQFEYSEGEKKQFLMNEPELIKEAV